MCPPWSPKLSRFFSLGFLDIDLGFLNLWPHNPRVNTPFVVIQWTHLFLMFLFMCSPFTYNATGTQSPCCLLLNNGAPHTQTLFINPSYLFSCFAFFWDLWLFLFIYIYIPFCNRYVNVSSICMYAGNYGFSLR